MKTILGGPIPPHLIDSNGDLRIDYITERPIPYMLENGIKRFPAKYCKLRKTEVSHKRDGLAYVFDVQGHKALMYVKIVDVFAKNRCDLLSCKDK